jgi:hypothetical protein
MPEPEALTPPATEESLPTDVPVAPSGSDPQVEAPPTGQLILGTDKRNPVFAVYEDESGERLLVYYGFELMEIVNDEPSDPGFKLLLARLYNAGVKLSAICESFEVDPKTVRRWGQALRQGDAAELVRVLEGRGAGRKRTEVVEKFAHLRWPDLVAEGSYGAVRRLLGEIQDVFGVSLSRSGISDLVRELKSVPPVAPLAPQDTLPVFAEELAVALAVIAPEESTPAVTGIPADSGETAVKSLEAHPTENTPHAVANPAVNPALPVGLACGDTAHPSPFFPRDPAASLYWCDHAGVLIFAAALAGVSYLGAREQTILAQWLAALWLGAQNIEQSKFLNWEDLALILGGVVRFPTPQREELKALAADPKLVDELFRFNQRNLGPAVGSDFYFDPHTKHYTGEQNVLKGWCSKIRFADKVLQSDFIHTAQGAPIYFETTDSFADLRQRFCGVIARARQALQWPASLVPTFVVDRAIHGAEFFERAAADPTFHLITWEKGFVAQPWEAAQVMGKTSMTRCRNSSSDLVLYHFDFLERPWEKNPNLRQMVVQATDERGRTIQVAILTDDFQRAATEIIEVMFKRWLQENDFKYLDKHFGINQITSYRSIEYAQLKGQVEDRQIKSVARKALDGQLKQVTEPLKRRLLAEEQALQAHLLRAKTTQDLQAQLAQEAATDTPAAKALRRQLAAAKAADRRYETTRLTRRKDIEEGHQQLANIQIQINATAAKESRIDSLIEAAMVKMDGQCKRLMDGLRITARNLFYQLFQPFKAAYDNYRDDHDHFRKLTQSPGVIEVSAQQIVIHLMPRTNYGGQLKKAVLQTLDGLNAQGLHHPRLPGRKLKFRLGQRAEMELKMNPLP